MKKILFSSAAAICSVMGLSAFKTASTFNTHYFSVSSGNLDRSTTGSLTDADITFISNSKPVVNPCTAGSNYLCVVGFLTNALTAGGQHINTVGGAPATISSFSYTKN